MQSTPGPSVDTVQDDAEVSKALTKDDVGNSDAHADSDSEDLDDQDLADENEAGPSAAGASTGEGSKKKKKKKKKVKKLIDAFKGKHIPDALVDRVTEHIRQNNADIAPNADPETVRAALEQLKVADFIKGKAGIAGRGKKEGLAEHRFWATQPVPQPGEGPVEADGFIEPAAPREEVKQDPWQLPSEVEWCIMDLNDPDELREVYELLSANYVEDDGALFRFQYSASFLEWALKPPGYYKNWHVGVRVKSNKKLVAFISGVPVALRVRDNAFRAVEVNYLCVHKKLRSKRMAPVLIKEITRQAHLEGYFQAIYTAGVLLPTPVATCRYFHRSLNVPKLVDINFTHVPRNQTLSRMVRLHKLPSAPRLANASQHRLREMEEKDLPEVLELYKQFMARYTMAPIMTPEDVRHQLLSGRGVGDELPGHKGRREKQVVWSYVVENPQSKKITDFFSFYSLPSTIMQNSRHNLLEAAYMFYYATNVALEPGSEEDGRLKHRLQELVTDALIIADQAKFDVFNALTLMDNVDFLSDLRFGAGDGMLNFYLYNWRTSPLAGMNETGGVKPGRGVGVVML